MERTAILTLAASASVMGAALAVNQLIKTISRMRSARPALWAPPPHPAWQPPAPQPPPFATDGRIAVDPTTLPPDRIYPLMISAVVPRPVAFVSTVSDAGVGNLAPFSYFNVVSHNPPHVVVGFAASRERSHGRKDTLVNILETKELVVNLISEWFVEAANYCCGTFDYGEDEMQLAGLTPAPSTKVRPPRVHESAVSMECVLRHTYETKNSKGAVTGTIVLAEVVMLHIHEGVAGSSPTGKLVVDINKLQPISRLGGNTYARVSGCFDLPRPDRST